LKKDYYIYPAIFEYDNDDISISFPDLPGCISCASNDEEALYMAKDALGLFIASSEEDGDELPSPTPLNNIKLKNNQKPILVEVNMPLFREAILNISVKKTLTIPKWINDLAEKNGLLQRITLTVSPKEIVENLKFIDNSLAQCKEELSKYEEVNLFLRGITPLMGFKWSTVEYSRKKRFAGESKYPLNKMLSFANLYLQNREIIL